MFKIGIGCHLFILMPHIVQMAPNIISIGYALSRHLFNPITMPNSTRTILTIFMVKIGIGCCHVFILNATHCPDGPEYHFTVKYSESASIQFD